MIIIIIIVTIIKTNNNVILTKIGDDNITILLSLLSLLQTRRWTRKTSTGHGNMPRKGARRFQCVD